MSGKESIRRYLIFLVGVFFAGCGISAITAPGLGTSPVTSLASVLSIAFSHSLGTLVLLTNTMMLVAQGILLGRRLGWIQLFQLPATLLLSVFVDLSGWVISMISYSSYPARILILLCGCVVLGLGIALEMIAQVLILPGEGIVKAIVIVSRKEFGRVKTVFDLVMVLLSVGLSLLLLGRVEGVREGTVISALIVGSIARFFCNRLEGPLLKGCGSSK